ncbi:acyl-CoA dehydrogenase family protein [Neomicrococcus lactis]|uniref:acyl-CoA dehydrogenase family protein n=1 Tax=Neomicrococcus lactis TaxID=732241 RepID=UPI0023017DF3|nr:acyl-CoA dehydrogenase family protein [Neomicrococcus lactis]
MSQQQFSWSLAVGTEYQQLQRRFAPIFARIAEGALSRDLERILPFEQVKWLDDAGFGALRVPAEFGGAGVSLETLGRLLIDLAAADSNVAHLYRSHLGFVESVRFFDPARRSEWYGRILQGETVGNASTEKGGNVIGTLNTKLTRALDGTWRLNGEKFYSTGTVFSDYTRVSVAVEGREGRSFVLVPINALGVSVFDDWDGFGQKLTGTGTTVFDDVVIPENLIFERTIGTLPAITEAAFFQYVLLAVLAGIARGARDAAAELVSKRQRTFNTGSGLPFREDPLIQSEIGRIAAKAFAAESTVLATGRELDTALNEALETGDVSGAYRGEVAVEAAQIIVPELSLDAAQALFLTVGASATSTSKGLDRFWRNAQTVATHNPIAFRTRSLGDFYINGTIPEGLNAIGDAKPQTA